MLVKLRATEKVEAKLKLACLVKSQIKQNIWPRTCGLLRKQKLYNSTLVVFSSAIVRNKTDFSLNIRWDAEKQKKKSFPWNITTYYWWCSRWYAQTGTATSPQIRAMITSLFTAAQFHFYIYCPKGIYIIYYIGLCPALNYSFLIQRPGHNIPSC